jgi:hypothetical protein
VQAAGPDTPAGLEFYDPVQSPFLGSYSSGRNSPYGEQGLLLLQSLAEQQGLDIGAYAGLYYDSYSNGFEGYMNASTVVSAWGSRKWEGRVCVWGGGGQVRDKGRGCRKTIARLVDLRSYNGKVF